MHFATLPGFDIRFLAMSATSTVRATPLGQAVRAHLFYRNWSRLSQSRTWISVVRIPFAFKGIGLLWPNTLTVQADSLHTPAGVVLIYFSFRFAAAPRQVHSTFIFYFGCKANSHSLSKPSAPRKGGCGPGHEKSLLAESMRHSKKLPL